MVSKSIDTGPTDWAGKTYKEIRDIAASDGSLLIIPVGSIEQHGHHLPVSTDTLLADSIAHLGAERVTDDLPVLVTPPVWAGYSPHHMSLGGTITNSHDGLLDQLEAVAGSALDNGFDAVLLVNGHGGNNSIITSARSTIGEEHPDVEVTGVTYFKLAASFIDEIRESDIGGMSHAGEFETSLMCHLYPELVGEDRAAELMSREYTHGLVDMFEGGPLSVYREFEEYSETGAIGSPELASAEKGERIYDRLGDELESVIREIHEKAV